MAYELKKSKQDEQMKAKRSEGKAVMTPQSTEINGSSPVAGQSITQYLDAQRAVPQTDVVRPPPVQPGDPNPVVPTPSSKNPVIPGTDIPIYEGGSTWKDLYGSGFNPFKETRSDWENRMKLGDLYGFPVDFEPFRGVPDKPVQTSPTPVLPHQNLPPGAIKPKPIIHGGDMNQPKIDALKNLSIPRILKG